MGSTSQALANAKKALDSANKFTNSVTGGKPNAFSYSAAHTARKAEASAPAHKAEPSKEFMGVRSNEAPELNAALQAREDAKKALDQ
jgi:hypothetical protein